MKEEDIDSRIERVVSSTASKIEQMAKWDEERAETEIRHKVAARRRHTYGLSAAASVIVICAVGLGVYFNRPTAAGPSYEFSPEGQAVFRGGATDLNAIVDMIDSARYDIALAEIDRALADTVVDPAFTPQRRQYLHELIAYEQYELTWLKIRALLLSGRDVQAQELLKEYIRQEGGHQAEAIQLLENK